MSRPQSSPTKFRGLCWLDISRSLVVIVIVSLMQQLGHASLPLAGISDLVTITTTNDILVGNQCAVFGTSTMAQRFTDLKMYSVYSDFVGYCQSTAAPVLFLLNSQEGKCKKW